MRSRLIWLGIVICAWVAAGSASSVRAQGWLADRDRAEGRGFRLGDFELHPGIGTEVGYDSNVFLSDEPESSGILRVAPHIYLSTLGEERMGEDVDERKLSFQTGLSGTFKHYFATDAGTNMGATQDAKLRWRPGGAFGLDLTEELKRSIDPFAEAAAPDTTAGTATTSDVGFGRDQFAVGARVQLATPGAAYKVGTGYRFEIDHFESDAFRNNRSRRHSILADTSWEFLPKTALFWDGSVGFHDFIHDSLEMDAAAPGELSLRHDSTTVRTRIGLNGAWTPTLGFTIAAGYAAGFYEDNNDFENVLAQVQARWRPRENVQQTLGYEREFTPAFQGNYTRLDRLKSRTQVLLGGVVVIAANVELTFLTFGTDPIQGERDDIHLLGNLSGEYRFVDWFALTAELGYWENFTDFVFRTGTGPDLVEDPAEYRRFEAWLGVRAFW